MNLTKETAVTGVRKNSEGKVIAFNINRKVWGRGRRGGSLLGIGVIKNEEGKQTGKQINMCCLGVYGRACGISARLLKDKGMPSTVCRRLPKGMEWTVTKFMTNSPIAFDLSRINDSSSLTDSSKEREIKGLFAKQGIKVRFVGKG